MMIIAEAGINHNGSYDKAVKLAEKSYEVGADAVKFQTFWNIRRLQKYEFSKEKWIKLKKKCDDIGITFLSTPHTFDAIHFLDDLVPMYKIASTYLGNANFLMEVNDKDKPILLSTGNFMRNTGMATYQEVKNAVKYVDVNRTTLLLCRSKYPTYHFRIDRVDEYTKLGCNIGLSDHTKSIKIPKLPVIEKHIMLDNMKCPDEKVSLTPSQFKEMIEWLKSS